MKDNKKCLVCDFVDVLYAIYDYQTFDDSDVTEEEYKEAKRQFLILFRKLMTLSSLTSGKANSIYEKDLKDEA